MAKKPKAPPKPRVLKGKTYRQAPRIVSFPIEQPMPVPFYVAGRPEWLARNIGAAAPLDRQWPVENADDAGFIINWCGKQKRLGLDTESTGPRENDGLDPVSPTSRLVLAQIGTPERVWLLEPALLDIYPGFKQLLERRDILFILQHAVHDFKFLLQKHHIHLLQMFDTMLAEQILTAGREGVKVGLAELARKYPPYRYIRKDVREQFVGHNGIFTPEQLYYAARDITLLFPIADGQIKKMADLDLKPIARDEFDCIPATAEMELTGVFVDTERLILTMHYFQRLMAVAERKVMEVYNAELRRRGLAKHDLLGEVWETFDLKSPAQKMEALRRLGVHVLDVQRSTLMTQQHPICAPMADFMECQKNVSTYGEGLLKRIHHHTRKVHPKFNQHGAGEAEAGDGGRDTKGNIATGRYSGNLQQLPRPEKIFDEVTAAAELALVRGLWPERFAA